MAVMITLPSATLIVTLDASMPLPAASAMFEAKIEVAFVSAHAAGATGGARPAADAVAAKAVALSVRTRLAHDTVQLREAVVVLASVVGVLALGAFRGHAERPRDGVVVVGLVVVRSLVVRPRGLLVQSSSSVSAIGPRWTGRFQILFERLPNVDRPLSLPLLDRPLSLPLHAVTAAVGLGHAEEDRLLLLDVAIREREEGPLLGLVRVAVQPADVGAAPRRGGTAGLRDVKALGREGRCRRRRRRRRGHICRDDIRNLGGCRGGHGGRGARHDARCATHRNARRYACANDVIWNAKCRGRLLYVGAIQQRWVVCVLCGAARLLLRCWHGAEAIVLLHPDAVRPGRAVGERRQHRHVEDAAVAAVRGVEPELSLGVHGRRVVADVREVGDEGRRPELPPIRGGCAPARSLSSCTDLLGVGILRVEE
eukprot:scaffold61250_cov65-Phaeocystis_antarctica.AAC.9